MRGIVDRVDVAPDGVSAVVRDYKTGEDGPRRHGVRAPGAAPAPALHARGARHPRPRPGRGPLPPACRVCEKRPPAAGPCPQGGRAPARASTSCAAATSARGRRSTTRSRPRSSAPPAPRGGCAPGDIDRDPIGGKCPKYCTFQPICRLERALGLEPESERRRRMSADGEGGRRPPPASPPSSARPSRPAIATSSARPARAAARPACSSSATARPSTTTASRSTRCWRSPSPSAPRPSCAPGPPGADAPLAGGPRRRRPGRGRELADLARATERAWVMTIHAFCRRLLARAPACGRARPPLPRARRRPRPRAFASGRSPTRSTACSPRATRASHGRCRLPSRGAWRR